MRKDDICEDYKDGIIIKILIFYWLLLFFMSNMKMFFLIHKRWKWYESDLQTRRSDAFWL